MRTIKCDILVVGGGPAGTSAALAAVQKCCHVVVVEQHSQIGTPVRCAEYIPAPLVGEVNLGSKYVVQPIKGMRTVLPNGEVKEILAPGFTINRDLFDRTLAGAAEKAGSRIFTSTKAIALKDGTIKVIQNELEFLIQAKVIIGADGPHSKVAKWINSLNRNMLIGAGIIAPLLKPLSYTEVYFDKNIFGGYGWLFPKKDYANVGVGIKPGSAYGRPIKSVLKSFIARLVREKKIAVPENEQIIAGWIPAEAEKKVAQNNILLVGDAAGHTHPITGAGIFAAVIGGRAAGRWAAKAILENDMLLLSEYENEMQDFLGPTLGKAFRRRCQMEKNWGDLEIIIKQCWVAFREYYATAV